MKKKWFIYSIPIITLSSSIVATNFIYSNNKTLNSSKNLNTKKEITNETDLNNLAPVASINFESLDESIRNEFNQEKASNVTYDDLVRYLLEAKVFRFYKQSEYDEINDFNSLAIFNIIDELDEYDGNFLNMMNTLFENNPRLRFNDELGLINVQLKVKKNTQIKVYINPNYEDSYETKPTKQYIVSDYLEFSITNFKNKNELFISNQTINALNTPLANVNGTDQNFNDVAINTLLQFQDSEVLEEDKRILVTNFSKKYFISKYKPHFEVLSSKFASSQVFVKLTLDLFNHNESRTINDTLIEEELNPESNHRFFAINTDTIYFSIINLKNNISIQQNTVNYDISVNVKYSNYTVNDFVGNSTDAFTKNVLNLINYANDRVQLKNPLFTTNLTRKEFNSKYVRKQFIVGSNKDDIKGVISGSKLIIEYPMGPLETENIQYIKKEFIFNIYNLKQNILINAQKEQVFDVSDDAVLNSINVNYFNDELLLDSLVKYENVNLDKKYLIATNVSKNTFKSIIKSIRYENLNETNGELDVIIEFEEIKNLPELKSIKYHLIGFEKQINISQRTKNIDKNYFEFIRIFNKNFISNNQLVQEETVIAELKKVISINLDQLFLFDKDQIIESKLFSVNTNKEFFLTNVISNDVQVHFLVNLGIINIKIPLKQHKGIKVNGSSLNPTNAYLEFNIDGYNANYQANLTKSYLEVSKQSLGIKNSNDVNNSSIMKHFISTSDNNATSEVLKTSLSNFEMQQYFIQEIIIDKSALTYLGFIYVNIRFSDNFKIDSKIVEIRINGFNDEVILIDNNNDLIPESWRPIYFLNQDRINNGIENNPKFNSLVSREFKIEDFNNNFLGFNGSQKNDLMVVFNCSEMIYNKFLLKEQTINYGNNYCEVIIKLNSANLVPKQINYRNGAISDQEIRVRISGFYEKDESWIIIVAVLVPVFSLTIITIILVLWLLRRKKVKEIQKEKMLL